MIYDLYIYISLHTGEYLASAGDGKCCVHDLYHIHCLIYYLDCTICLWKLNEENDVVMETNLEDDVNQENWTVAKMLRYNDNILDLVVLFDTFRGHLEDVYDLSWSSNSRYLLSGSVDNTAIVWDTLSG